MDKFDRITVDPAVMGGQPCLRGLRLTVQRVLEVAALYPDPADRAREYPDLTAEDVAQARAYVAAQNQ